MSDSNQPQPGESVSGMEYPSALAALEDRQIFGIVPIEGGFEIREKGRDEYFVRLLPEPHVDAIQAQRRSLPMTLSK